MYNLIRSVTPLKEKIFESIRVSGKGSRKFKELGNSRRFFRGEIFNEIFQSGGTTVTGIVRVRVSIFGQPRGPKVCRGRRAEFKRNTYARATRDDFQNTRRGSRRKKSVVAHQPSEVGIQINHLGAAFHHFLLSTGVEATLLEYFRREQ